MSWLSTDLFLKFRCYLLIRIQSSGGLGRGLNFRHVKKRQDVEELSVEPISQLLCSLLDLKLSSLIGLGLCNDLCENLLAGLLFWVLLWYNRITSAATEVHRHDHLVIKFAQLLISIFVLVIVT